MDAQEIIRCIDAGANHYISVLGDAEHMERLDNGIYSCVRPKPGREGISFIYNIRLDALTATQKRATVQEIKALGMPFWLNLSASDEDFRIFFGKDKAHGQTEFAFDDEQYLAMMPDDFVPVAENHHILEVNTPEQFATWAKIANDILADGRQDVHPTYHYPLLVQGKIRCYLLYDGDDPAAVACTMPDGRAASLELVATLPPFRCKGYARAVCARAVQEAIRSGCEVLTVRANTAASASVYRAIGFTVYNHLL